MKMKQRFFSRGLHIALPLILLLPAVSSAKDKDYVNQTVSWNITNSQVVDYGRTASTGNGTMVQGYTVEALATSDNAPITDGLFMATITAYSPQQDTPHQKAGTWYVKAKWEILDNQATKDELKIKHSGSRMHGFLTAELPFNPAARAGKVDAQVDFPLKLVGNYWGQGSGGFYGNELLEGNMNLTFSRWQKVE